MVGGHQYGVAEAFAAQHRRIGDQGQLGEADGGGGDLAAQMRERRSVGEVGGVPAAGAQCAADVVEELGRGQMGRGAGAAEDIGDDEVGPAVGHLGEPFAGVRRPHPDPGVPVQRQLTADELDEGRVPLDDLLGGAGAGGGGVAGQGEGAAAEVHGLDRAAGWGDEVDDVAEPPLVLEGEEGRVVQVDVRLRRPVDEQGPGARPVPVGYQLGEPSVDGLDDGGGRVLAPGVSGLAHSAIMRSGA